jgi:hypothetical protein
MMLIMDRVGRRPLISESLNSFQLAARDSEPGNHSCRISGIGRYSVDFGRFNQIFRPVGQPECVNTPGFNKKTIAGSWFIIYTGGKAAAVAFIYLFIVGYILCEVGGISREQQATF